MANRRWLGITLMLVFLLSMVTRGAHALLEHHEIKLRCQAGGEDQHLHDSEDFHNSTCLLCLLQLTQFPEPERSVLPSPDYKAAGFLPVAYSLFLTTNSESARQDRAPPVL